MYLKYIEIGLCFIWLGMLIGVSFISTPAKFLVSSLELKEALLIGKATFGIFTKLELAMLVIVVVIAMVQHFRLGADIFSTILIVILIGFVCVQVFAILPGMDQRIHLLEVGQNIAPSKKHTLYVVLELMKFLILLVLGLRQLSNLYECLKLLSPQVSKTFIGQELNLVIGKSMR